MGERERVCCRVPKAKFSVRGQSPGTFPSVEVKSQGGEEEVEIVSPGISGKLAAAHFLREVNSESSGVQ